MCKNLSWTSSPLNVTLRKAGDFVNSLFVYGPVRDVREFLCEQAVRPMSNGDEGWDVMSFKGGYGWPTVY